MSPLSPFCTVLTLLSHLGPLLRCYWCPCVSLSELSWLLLACAALATWDVGEYPVDVHLIHAEGPFLLPGLGAEIQAHKVLLLRTQAKSHCPTFFVLCLSCGCPLQFPETKRFCSPCPFFHQNEHIPENLEVLTQLSLN